MKNSSSCFAFIVTLVIGAIYPHHANAAEIVPNKNKVPAEVRFVAAGIANAYQQLKCAQASVAVNMRTLKEYFLILQTGDNPPQGVLGRTQDEEQSETAQWYFQKPKLSMIVPITAQQEGTLRNIRLVADEERASILNEHVQVRGQTGENQNKERGDKEEVFYIGRVFPLETVFQNGMWTARSHLDPRYYAYYAGDKTLDQQFLAEGSNPTYLGEEVIDGSRCMKIELRPRRDLRSVYWIDVDHSFLLRRWEVYASVQEQMYLRMDWKVSKLSESNGIWFPSLVETRELFPKKALPEYRNIADLTETIPVRITRISISDFKADCSLPQNIFELKWPPGTTLHDQIADKTIVIGRESSKTETSAEKQDQSKKGP